MNREPIGLSPRVFAVISAAKPGPLWKRMMILYQDYNAALLRGNADQVLHTSGSRAHWLTKAIRVENRLW